MGSPVPHSPTRLAILGKEDIVIDFDLWGSFVVNDLLLNLSSSTYVLITDTNLFPLYVPSFREVFQRLNDNSDTPPRLLTYEILAKARKAEKQRPKSKIGCYQSNAPETPS